MRLIVSFIISTLVCASSSANSNLDWLVDLPSYIDKAIKINSEERIYCKADESDTANTHKNPYQACLEKICGHPKSFTSALDSWKKDYVELSGKDTEELKKTPVGKILHQKIDEFYKEDSYHIADEEMKKEFLEMASNPIDNTKVSVHGASGIIVALEDINILNHGEYNNETGRYEIKDSVFEGLDAAKKARIEDLKKVFEARINSQEEQYRHVSSQEFIKRKYPNLDLRSGILKYIEKLSSIEDKFIKNIGGIIPFPLDLVNLQKRTEYNEISSVELDKMIAEANSIELMGHIFDHQDKFGDEIAAEVSDKLKKWFQGKSSEEVKKLLEKKMIEKHKEQVEGDKKRFQERDKSTEICLDSYHRNSNLFPDEDSIDKLKTTVDFAKGNFIAKVLGMSWLSEESKKHIKSSLEEIRFKLPYSKSTYKDVLINSLSKKLSINKKSNEFLKNNWDMRSLFTFFTYSVAFPSKIGGNDDDEGKEYDGEIAEICQGLEQRAFGDSTYTAFGEVKVSYTLAKAPRNYQLQVIYHELGHNLEKILRESSISDATNKAFKVTESCLGDIQKKVSGEEKHKNFFVEDFSDWIAAKVENDFTKSADCEYLSFDQESQQYKNNTIFADHEDTLHSSTVFRVMRYYVDKEKDLPDECREPLTQEGILGFEQQCSI